MADEPLNLDSHRGMAAQKATELTKQLLAFSRNRKPPALSL